MTDTRRLGDPGNVAFQLDKYPFYLLNRLVALYNATIEERLRSIGLEIPYWRVLMILGEISPLGIRDIALRAVINLSTMTRIIQRMSAADLVACRRRAEDSRVTEVWLTPTGEEKLAQARAVTSPVYRQIIQGFSEDQFEQLIAATNQLYDNLSALGGSQGD